MKRYFILSIFFFVFYAVSNAAHGTKDSLRLLFVGNSLTYTNDLPELVKEIGELDGKRMICDMIALPDYSLEDHWNDGNAAAAIQTGQYDYVIFQQGPSALPESQVLLKTYAKKFSKVCNDAHTSMALFMVWPSKARAFDFENVLKSYANAATETGSVLCPAGLAWLNVWQVNQQVPLYGPDSFHPGIDGSVLAAMTIYWSLQKNTTLDFLNYTECSWKKVVSKDIHSLFQSVVMSIPH